MSKYQMLVNKQQEQLEEGKTLHYKLEGTVALKYLNEIEDKLDEMKTKLNNERTQRWRNWVEFMGAQKEIHLQVD
eukprot:6978487-Heterocapsa_arctica.AAC.1